jgi:hypothetical protein
LVVSARINLNKRLLKKPHPKSSSKCRRETKKPEFPSKFSEEVKMTWEMKSRRQRLGRRIVFFRGICRLTHSSVTRHLSNEIVQFGPKQIWVLTMKCAICINRKCNKCNKNILNNSRFWCLFLWQNVDQSGHTDQWRLLRNKFFLPPKRFS